MIVTIEARIATTQANAREIADVLDRELARRIVYIGRAHVLISLARDAGEVMARTEAAGVESDFGDSWHVLRRRLTGAQGQFERIIAAGGDSDSDRSEQ